MIGNVLWDTIAGQPAFSISTPWRELFRARHSA
jgi:hypothetical protein